MQLNSITIIGGIGKNGQPETVDPIELAMGTVVSIVGPTGCGKTTLINDIEMFANANTPSRRRILFNGQPWPQDHAGKHPIALISQHTNFLSDLPVHEFLTIHAHVRQHLDTQAIVAQTLAFANELTGEPIIEASAMTELSGGQTRALLIADAVIIGAAPIILLDEIENAGIHRTKALDMLKAYQKIFVFVTHDPRIALLSDFRIVMKNGAMTGTIGNDSDEQIVASEIKKLDDLLLHFRTRIRAGERLTSGDLRSRLRALEYVV